MFFTLFQISTLITATVSFFGGLLVYLQERKSKINRFWFLTSILIITWNIGLFGVVYSTNKSTAWIWQNVLDVSAIFLPIAYLQFIIYLIHKEKHFFRTIILTWIAGLILAILSFTNLLKTGVSPKFGQNFWVDPGILYFLFPTTFALFVLIATFLLLKEYYRANDNILKQQVKYVLIAQTLGFGGGVTNFFPQLFNIQPFGNYLVAFYIIFIGYAALKHHLFDIRIIVTELFTFALWIFLLVRVLLFENQQDFIINGSIFVVVVVAGTLLIRSVLKEVEQREKLEELTREVEKAYEVEKKAHEGLRKLDEAKNQFLMATQHHLRTPLTAMRGYLDLISGGTYGRVPIKIKETLFKFQISTMRLIRIVNELLDISQFQLGKEVVLLQPDIDLMPMFKEVDEELRYEAEAKDIYLKVESLKQVLPKIKADPEKLKVALFNIVDNAIKYTHKGGVTVECKTTDDKLQIIVRDTGIGMSKEDLEGLFEKFFERGKEAQKVFALGRGIGVFLSSQIVKAHNGRIWAESEGKDKGSAFYIELPCSRA